MCGTGYTVAPSNPAADRIPGLCRHALPVTLPVVAVFLQNRHVPWAPVFVELLNREVPV